MTAVAYKFATLSSVQCIWELITMVWMERRREGKRRLGHKACGVDAVRRAVGCAGAERKTQQGGVPKRRCRQPGGHGGQEHMQRPQTAG